jgi:predicted SAM-dependent methyltransferase
VVSLLNLGCGTTQPDGFVHVDREDYGTNDVCDFVADGLPYPPWSFDGIVANHSLQQVPFHDWPGVLAECERILTPGGVLRIIVPDVAGAFDAYKRGNWDWFPNGEATIGERLTAYLTWYSTNLVCCTPEFLGARLHAAGFKGVTPQPPGRSALPELAALDDRLGESLFYEGTKP